MTPTASNRYCLQSIGYLTTWNVLDVIMGSAHFRAPPCLRKGLRPPETNRFPGPILVSMNSFLPERADIGHYRKELM
jgi:hypothetical protein